MKALKKEERDFLVCSDCIYYKANEIFDNRYPDITRGICSLHDKIVDNRWETKCEDNTGKYSCKNCQYFEYDENNIAFCNYYDNDIDENDICEKFELEV